MANSTLVDCTVMSPNHSGTRNTAITRITPHCVVGQLTAEGIGYCFTGSRQASSNYGIGTDGRVGLYVDESFRAWTTSSYENDNAAITIECASDTTHPYAFNDVVWQKLIDFCVDACRRHGKKKLLWLGSLNATLYYEQNSLKDDEFLLTAHRWFASTACPGDWMYSREEELARRVTMELQGKDKWMKNDTGWWWQCADGSYPTNKWKYINAEWYYFNDSGYAVTGWRNIDGNWYWFNNDCQMQTGWQRISEKWYYFKESGEMQIGWSMYASDGKWYYLDPTNGEMVSDEFRLIDGSWYRFNTNGEMLEKTTLHVGEDGVIC